MPDCGSHSCLYAEKKSGMRTNGRCTCDDCPTCGSKVRPMPVLGVWQMHAHYSWCPDTTWRPEHHRGWRPPGSDGVS